MPETEIDYCAEAARLREIYTEHISGEGISEARFGEDAVRYGRYDKAALLAEVRRLEDLCSQSQGSKPRRRAKAISGSYRHRY